VLKDQASYYISDYDTITYNIGIQANNIADALTLDTNFNIAAPLETEFVNTQDIQAFLNATLLTIIIYLAMLSTMLLYSLMLTDVDGKTYEYGMLRALGFKKSYLTRMIMMQSFGFSIPGIAFGLAVAFIINIMLRELIFHLSDNAESYDLTTVSIIIGVTFGIVMPLISNYFPIQAALGKNLRNSLDLSRRTTDEIGIKVQRLEDIGMSFNQVMIGLILLWIGFSTYYLVPMAVLEGNVTLTFVILNILLIFIIVGMTFICVLLFEPIENMLLWICLHTCCFCDRKMHKVITKNMDAHRIRNQKTSIMFTMSISFLIFAASSFQMMATLIEKTSESLIGADIYSTAGRAGLLNEKEISAFLEGQMAAESQPVYDYCFTGMAFDDWQSTYIYGPNLDSYIFGVSYYRGFLSYVYSVPENYFNVTDTEFYVPIDWQDDVPYTETDDGKVDIISMLYSYENIPGYPSASNIDPYGVTVQSNPDYNEGWDTKAIRFLLASGT
jgi:hypothetical protein